MKRNLTFIVFGMLVLVLATGCDRGNRRLLETPTPEAQSPTSSPTAAPAQPTFAPTDLPTSAASATSPEPTITPTAMPSVSESDQMANQLDELLKQFDQELGALDTVADTPPAP